MKKKITAFLYLSVAMLLFTACGLTDSLTAQKGKNEPFSAANAGNVQQAGQMDGATSGDTSVDGEQPKSFAPDDAEVYLIVKNDLLNYQMTLMDLADGSTICYEYTEGTEFFDKYGDYALREEFSEGKLAAVTRLNSNDTLGGIAFTDRTWDYEDVRNYSIDTQKGRMSISDTAYQCGENFKVFSDGVETDVYAIGENDVLDVYGVDRAVCSVVIKSGHGTLELTNTELFEGGWLNLGTQVYTTVTKDMTMEIPEGIYKFAVANDGYGDSGEIRIRRGQTTTIDLNDYKGEGPKMCRVSFRVEVADTVLRLDGKKIDYSKPVEVRYGVHILSVRAKNFDNWSRQLVINSPTAKIDILQTEDQGKSNSAKQGSSSGQAAGGADTQQEGGRAGSLAGSMAGSMAGSNSSAGGASSNTNNSSNSSNTATSGNKSSSALADAALGSSLASIITGGDSKDYLDTLADLVKSLDKLNSASSKNGD